MKKSILTVSIGLLVVFISIAAITRKMAPKPTHYIGNVDPVKVKQGRELITQGFITDSLGGQSKIQSKHFVCIDCHSTEKEFENITLDNAADRLEYGKKNKKPYLPGSTLYGIVNRTSWYNDDYEKKYGSLVDKARDTLENAIQLCATVCSQGRALESNEMESVLHYLWSKKYNEEDLRIGNKTPVTAFRAHFAETLPVDQRKLGEGGDVENGEYIYNYSCLHCHDHKYGAANFKLDNSKLTFQMLKRHFNDFTDKSIYQIIRHGTSPEVTNKPYMPLFSKEKMSDSQIEDLAAYIDSNAE